jgi:SPP1 gp7 family putative phage head morphogenesis protein
MCVKCATIELSVKVDGLEPELLRVAKLIHSGKLKPGQIDPGMVRKIANQLSKGIFKGYGKGVNSAGLSEAQKTFLTDMQHNVFVFSGFKNYHELKEVSLLLKTDDGKVKSFDDFMTDVKKIDKTYNEVYLSAEYGNCVASAQMARAWQDMVENDVDMLTYQTAGDDRVREEHAILNGITEPLDSDFWSTYYPPNDWGCRCDAVPADNGSRKHSIPESELPDIPEMFQNNVGQTGIVFPDTHPYFDVAKSVGKYIREQVADILSEEE